MLTNENKTLSPQITHTIEIVKMNLKKCNSKKWNFLTRPVSMLTEIAPEKLYKNFQTFPVKKSCN